MHTDNTEQGTDRTEPVKGPRRAPHPALRGSAISRVPRVRAIRTLIRIILAGAIYRGSMMMTGAGIVVAGSAN
jgi:hypothetical protein